MTNTPQPRPTPGSVAAGRELYSAGRKTRRADDTPAEDTPSGVAAGRALFRRRHPQRRPADPSGPQ